MSKQSEYKTRITRLSVIPPDAPTTGDRGWWIEIKHGEYVAVSDIHDGGMINIDPEEWPALRAAIDRMIGECQDAHG